MALLINGVKVAGLGGSGRDGKDGDNGVGVPTGGAEGQVLVKNSENDYDTKWENLVSIDNTLNIEGSAADAKAVGDALIEINDALADKQNKNVIVYRDSETGKASMTASQIMEKVHAGENVYYTSNLSDGTLHPYLEGADTSAFFYSNYIDNNRAMGTGILIGADGTITTEIYQLGHLTDNVIHITSAERNRWNDTYTKTEADNLLEAKAEDSVKKYFLIVETTKQNDNYLLDGITFNEILEKFNTGNVNIVCHVDGTDYIPLLSVTSNKIMFSGIYQTTSVSLDFDTNGVGVLTSNSLVNQNRLQNYYYTKTETDTKIANLVNSAPETLDTLGELATALQENKEIVDVLNEAITNKADKDEVAQSDWNQNDVYAPSYVQNRTHWVDYAEKVLDSEVFECTTLASDSESYYCAKSGNIGLISGKKYNVTVNGTKYTVSALSTFGTNDISLIAEIDTCRIYDRENGTVEVFTDSSTTLTITIEEAEDIYVPLNEKFIPDVFARQTDIELKLNKENPIGSGALSINRAANSEIGENSVAIGTDCVASGESAIAMGSGVSATGFASHAEGSGSIAEGVLSHVEGQDSVATGYASHAENSGEANGNYSHAEGYSIADGDYSHASGNGTWAVGRSQTVIGEANQEDEAEDSATRGTYAFIVGNGDMDAGEYSNASTLDWEGNAWFAGDVYIGSTEGYNKDEGSKKLATEEYVNSILESLNYETWTFTLSNGTTVTKQVLIK